MSKQTALQWYRQQVMAVLSTGNSETRHMTEGQIFARALEMEREQHGETWNESAAQSAVPIIYKKEFDNHYDEKYGKEQNNG